jgi:hypothetical protein
VRAKQRNFYKYKNMGFIFKDQKTTRAEERTTYMGDDVGGIKFRKQVSKDGDSRAAKNDSFVLIQDWWGSLIRFWHNHIILRTPGDYTVNVGSNRYESVKGDDQKIVAGDRRRITKGDEKKATRFNQKELNAAKELEKINRKVQDARVEAAANNKIKTACPVCGQAHLVDRMSDNLTSISNTIEKYLGLVIPFKCFPFDIVPLLLGALVAPFLTVVKNIGLRGKECGSPGCKKGQVEVPNLKKADKAGADAIKAEKENISKYSRQLGSGGSKTEAYKTDLMIKVGLVKNEANPYKEVGHHTFPLRFVPAEKKPDVLVYDSKGSTKRILFLPPQRTQGSLMWDVANNFTVNAGSPGIDFQTSGQLTADTGSFSLKAGAGEAYIGSNNVTTVKGKNVIIDANDQSGDAGVLISSPHTMVQGSFNVRGDAAFKGHLTTDGPISVPHLIVPSMRTESTNSATSKFTTEGANWIGSAVALKAANLAKDLVFRYAFSGYITSGAGIVALATEIFDLARTAATLEPIPTGIYFGGCANAAGPGVSFGVIWNFQHNHTRAGEDHTHTVTSPKASYWNTRRGWGGERQAGNHIPTPNAAFGDSLSPGPKSKSGGACGGGALWIKNRNQNYGQFGDPFRGGNFVPVPINRDPDGTIKPPPQLSYIYSCTPYLTSNLTTEFQYTSGGYYIPGIPPTIPGGPTECT